MRYSCSPLGGAPFWPAVAVVGLACARGRARVRSPVGLLCPCLCGRFLCCSGCSCVCALVWSCVCCRPLSLCVLSALCSHVLWPAVRVSLCPSWLVMECDCFCPEALLLFFVESKLRNSETKEDQKHKHQSTPAKKNKHSLTTHRRDENDH